MDSKPSDPWMTKIDYHKSPFQLHSELMFSIKHDFPKSGSLVSMSTDIKSKKEGGVVRDTYMQKQ